MLDLNVVEIFSCISMITSFHLFNKRTMSSVRYFLSRNLICLMICNLCAHVHLINYSTYTSRHNQVTTFLFSRTRSQTTILQSNLFIHLIIQCHLRYYHTRIALRRASRILLTRRLFLVAGLAFLAVLCNAVVDQRTNIERRNTPSRGRALRLMSSPE